MKKMEINTSVKGVGGLLLDAGIGFGASYALGRAYHEYNDKWYGKQAPRILAAVGKVGALACSAFAGGRQTWLGSVSNSLGQAGVNAMGLEYGLRHARDTNGQKAVLVPKSTDTNRIAGAKNVSAIGALGTAAPGRGLSWDQIQELAQGH